MIVSLTHARQMWCCQARHESVLQVDRQIMVPCIPAACMAWRWATADAQTATPQADRLGYCGLAGKPNGVR